MPRALRWIAKEKAVVRIESVMIGKSRRVANNVGVTGIWKHPVATAEVTPLGLEGDFVADTKYHGGPDQAVYLYRSEDYA